MEGIKEVSEAVVGVNELGILVLKQFKDGVQFADFQAFYEHFAQNIEFKQRLEAAYNDFNKIPAEIKDLDISEGIQLAGIQLSYLPRIVEALKK